MHLLNKIIAIGSIGLLSLGGYAIQNKQLSDSNLSFIPNTGEVTLSSDNCLYLWRDGYFTPTLASDTCAIFTPTKTNLITNIKAQTHFLYWSSENGACVHFFNPIHKQFVLFRASANCSEDLS